MIGQIGHLGHLGTRVSALLDGARRRQKIRFDGLVDGAADRLPSSWPTPSEQLADADLDHDVAAKAAATS